MPEPQSATVKVRMPDGSQWAIPRESLLRAKARGAVEVTEKTPPKAEEEGVLKKVGRGTALGAFSGAGIAETQHPIRDTLTGLKQQLKDVFGVYGDPLSSEAWKKSLRANPIVSIPTSLGKGFTDVIEDVNPALDNLFRLLSNKTGGKKYGYKEFDPEKTAHDVASTATQIALLKGGKKAAETPLRESPVLNAPKAAAREVLGVTARDVEKARKPVEQRAAELRAEHEEKVSQARTKNRATYEAGEAEKKGEYAKKVSEVQKQRVEQSKIEGQRTSLEAAQERYSKQIAENLDKAEKMEKLSLDSEWEDFRKKVLGVSKETPNGTLQSNLTSVGKAVLEAKKAIVKGSATNIPIFKDLMGRFSEMVDTPEGAVPLEGQMIPTDQLRGYIRELDDKIYASELPSDVRNAMKHVSQVANMEVEAAIKDVHGKTTADAYRALKDRTADYLETWKDKSSGSPVPKIRALLREPISTRRGVPVYREVGDLLRGKDGEKIIATLARKRAFGADTTAIAKLRSAAEKLKGLPKPKEVAMPERPQPTTVAKFEAPKPPDIERFDADKFIRDAAESRAKSISRWGTAGAIAWMIRDMVHGNLPSPGLVAAPVVQHFLMRAMTSKGFLDWITEDIPRERASEPVKSTSPQSKKGASSGINPKGQEMTSRPASLEQKTQALRDELTDLREKLRRAPEGHPDLPLLLQRMVETELLIQEYESGKVH